jgi:hypothetical protein
MPVMSTIARPDALFVAHELQIEALARHADRYSVDAGQPSPQRPRGAGRYEGLGSPAKPSAARRSRPCWSSTRYSMTWSAWKGRTIGDPSGAAELTSAMPYN